jgi:hypothetical protein
MIIPFRPRKALKILNIDPLYIYIRRTVKEKKITSKEYTI